MIVALLQEHLNKALSRVGKIVSTKPQLPLLGNVLLQTKDNQLQLVTTNMETTMVATNGAKIKSEGGICVPFRLINEFVAALPQEKVEMEAKDNTLFVSCEGYKATIPGTGKEEFFPVPTMSEGGKRINKDAFLGAVTSVLFSAATDEGRPVLTGVRIIKEEGGTLLAATDGYRLSVKHVDTAFGDIENVIIPGRALVELSRLGQEEKEEEHILVSFTKDGQVGTKIKDTEIYTRVIEGEYPKFEKIIPKNATTTATIDKESFYRAVRSSAIFARDNSNIIKLHIKEGIIVVSANTPQVGENNVTVEAKTEGDQADIAFNSRFLIDFLNNFPEESFVFEMTGSLNPGAFKPAKDDSYVHIIMPVRVQG